MINIFLLKIVPFMRYCVKKYFRAVQVTDDIVRGIRSACCCNWFYKHTPRICNTYCFSTATRWYVRTSVLR